mgnify:CR=1 FL=1
MADSESTRITRIHHVAASVPQQPACLVVIYGALLGQRFQIPDGDGVLTIGRDAGQSIVLREDAVSRSHAHLHYGPAGVVLEDLGSTNGSYVNDHPVAEHQLEHGDLVKLGSTIFKFLDAGNLESAYFEEIHRMFIIDGLTEAYNRRYLMEAMDRDFSRARRYSRPLSLLMIDIDFFKRINDEYGHLTGDHVLRELSAIVRRRVRREEVFARYGGEEFALLLPETPLPAAKLYAEQLRSLVADHRFVFEGRELQVTISLGAAEWQVEMKTPFDLVAAADRKLYDAKAGGRNRVEG